jgi:hypothetical protein
MSFQLEDSFGSLTCLLAKNAQLAIDSPSASCPFDLEQDDPPLSCMIKGERYVQKGTKNISDVRTN